MYRCCWRVFFKPFDRYRLFREKILCALYCEDNGRPAVEPVLALGVSLLQFMGKVPDRKALLLERVFLEQYEVSCDTLAVRKLEKSGTVQNPHDPQAQWSSKDLAKTKAWIGYKVQVAESVGDCDEPRKRVNRPSNSLSRSPPRKRLRVIWRACNAL